MAKKRSGRKGRATALIADRKRGGVKVKRGGRAADDHLEGFFDAELDRALMKIVTTLLKHPQRILPCLRVARRNFVKTKSASKN